MKTYKIRYEYNNESYTHITKGYDTEHATSNFYKEVFYIDFIRKVNLITVL